VKLAFHRLRVASVIEETADARSIVFEVPAELAGSFAYRPGQHLTLRVPASRPALRCYSCSSIPGEPLRVTVKRMVDGLASGWLCTALKAGDTLEVAAPAGVFTPRGLDGEFLMFAGGSGITPVFSILRSVLANGNGRVRLVYANRDERSVIFAAELARLSREFPRRLQVIHWLDSVQGVAAQAQLAALGAGFEKAQCFICGPGLFMDCAAAALHDLGIPGHHVHIERFVSLPDDADAASAPQPSAAAGGTPVRIEVELDGAEHVVTGEPGQLLIESLEAAGLSPPFSCRAGACAACMCKLEDGAVELLHNHVLDQGELEAGWILACQAIPQSPTVRVRYSQ
jgi:3-ketosteroid 9alpha-monooxygenase subunit B